VSDGYALVLVIEVGALAAVAVLRYIGVARRP
jgi:hypothetical protein